MAPRPAVRKPEFFIVGAPRCGTSALKAYLEQHPELFLPPTKLEPHFFGSDLPHQGIVQDEETYLALFAGAAHSQKLGEKSARYLFSKRAAAEIKAYQPSAKIIALVRSPVEQISSFHAYRVFLGVEPLTDLKEALEAEEDRRRGHRLPPGRRPRESWWYLYRDCARYTEQIERYLDVFGRESVHVIIFDDLVAEPEAVYKETLRFLGVSPDFKPDFRKVHGSRRSRSRALQSFLTDPPEPLRGLVRSFVPILVRERLIWALRHLGSSPEARQPPNEALKRQLKEEFRPEVERLSALLGRDLTHWCQP